MAPAEIRSNAHYDKIISKIQIGKQESQRIKKKILKLNINQVYSQVNYRYMYSHSIILQAFSRHVYTVYVTLTP